MDEFETSADAVTPDAEQVDRSWRTGTGRALGSCGEVLSAVDADGRTWRLSLPLQRVVVAQMRFRPATSPKLTTPAGMPRSAEGPLTAAVHALDLDTCEVESVRGTYHSDLWNESALGGASASAAALIRALAAAAGDALDEAAVAGLLAAQGLDSSPAYRAARLLDVINGRAHDAAVPRFAVTVAAPRGGAARPTKPAGPAELATLRAALAAGDRDTVAAVATAHARRHSGGDPVLAGVVGLLDDAAVPGLLGVLTGGPGGAVALLFPGDAEGRAAAQRSAFTLLGVATGYAVSVSVTPAG